MSTIAALGMGAIKARASASGLGTGLGTGMGVTELRIKV